MIALLGIDGHDGFRHITAAWDDHHLFAERHAVAESSSLALYRVAATAGDVLIDPTSTNAYVFERIAREPAWVEELIGPVVEAQGFRGLLVLGRDDARASAVIYRFRHGLEIDAFRASPVAMAILGPIGAPGESGYAVHPVKTFA